MTGSEVLPLGLGKTLDSYPQAILANWHNPMSGAMWLGLAWFWGEELQITNPQRDPDLFPLQEALRRLKR